jgi:nitrogen regulatory protein PII
MVQAAKVTLVTVITGFELEERLMKELQGLGVGAFTVGKVDGRGTHGPRTASFFDASNLRFEMLVAAVLAQKILTHIEKKFVDQPIIAYAHEVDAVPRKRFS